MYEGNYDKEVTDKLDEYEDIFSEGFPTMQFDGNKKDLLETLNKCIKTKTKYDTSFWDKNPDCDT